ncbi:MAG: BBP7 family outer membrane beta-barrel protein [Planctomycetaceae bacterium]
MFRFRGRTTRVAAGLVQAAVVFAIAVQACAADEAPPGAVTVAIATDEVPGIGHVATDEACSDALRCLCCPDWRQYAVFDALFLQRNNQAGDQPLVFDTDTGAAVMTTQSLQPSVATGARVFYGELATDTWGWEAGYTGVYGMFGSATVAGAANLGLPPPLGLAVHNFGQADQVRATYWSTLNMAEFNVFRYDCRTECGRRARQNCHCIDWLGGFVWAGLDEQANIEATCCTPPEAANYKVRTSTNYYGAQVGMRGRREWNRWAVEGWWKTALCGTTASQGADPIVGTISGMERGAVSAWTTGVGFIGNLNATLVYRLTDVWGLRAGYNIIWLTNAALAPTQWDFATAEGAGTGINDNGVLFLHGANLGVEARW